MRSPLIPQVLLSATLFLSGFSSTALADVVHLNTQRDPMYGTVVEVSADKVILQTLTGNRLPFSRTSVRSIEFEHPTQAETSVPSTTLPQPALASMNTLRPNTPNQTISLTNDKGLVNEQQFITLSRFKGQTSQQTYAGLYNFANKGTLWIKLPKSPEKAGDLQFVLYGKPDNQSSPEKYTVRAQFLDENGTALEESPLASFDGESTEIIEWFQLLDGISGVTGKREVSWRVPEQTRTIEFRIITPDSENRHLVGYLGNLTLVIPEP